VDANTIVFQARGVYAAARGKLDDYSSAPTSTPFRSVEGLEKETVDLQSCVIEIPGEFLLFREVRHLSHCWKFNPLQASVAEC
jgi:hypothetical protein